MPRGRSILRSVSALAVATALVGALGCAAHPAEPAFRASVWIGDRGISIPLPPPSILKAPKQQVDVQGEVVGDEPVGPGVVAHVVDLNGDAESSVELAAGETGFVARGVAIDLTDNCLEVWLQGEDGAQSEHRFYAATIVVGGDGSEGVVVSADCDG